MQPNPSQLGYPSNFPRTRNYLNRFSLANIQIKNRKTKLKFIFVLV